ncbi:MAG: ATP-binding protein, partial [Synergistaceae bacterium]|nr:ATP-binding protein [Synergistaceae bacterium]
KSGRIAWYFYMKDGSATHLAEALGNDAEFELPRYVETKKANKPVHTDPGTFEIDGKSVLMFTIDYPIRDPDGSFIGVVAANLFLDDMYEQLHAEKIYETGYILIGNDKGRLIYSPNHEDIGKPREELGLAYPLERNESAVFFNTKNKDGKNTLVVVNSIYLPQLDDTFYLSVTAPFDEIYSSGTRLLAFFNIFDLIVLIVVLLILNWLIGRTAAPIIEIVDSTAKIADGDYSARITGGYKGEFAIIKEAVNKMADNIERNIEGIKGSLGIVESILQGIDAHFFVVDPEDGSLLFINDKMKASYNMQSGVSGMKCWEVMFPDSNQNGVCDHCPRRKLDLAPDKVYEWEEYIGSTGKYYMKIDRYIEWFDKRKVHLQLSTDITDYKLATIELGRRLEQQTLMTTISQSFLSNEDVGTLITRALRMIGEFIGASQILIFEFEDDNNTLICRNEWLNPDIGLDTQVDTKIALGPAMMPFINDLTVHKRLCLHSNDPVTKEAMASYRQNFKNYITTPVFIKGKMCAMMDFSREGDRPWDKSDIDLAMLVSSILSGIFERSGMESQSSIVENSPNLTIYITSDGKLEYANPAASAITGYSSAELLNGGLGMIFDEQSVRDIKEKYIPDTLRNGISYFEIDMTCRDAKKQMAFTSFTAPERENHFGVHIGAIANDVTEIRWLESELIAAKELAEQSSRAKSDFMARMSHEMRTHMNTIIGMSQIAQGAFDAAEKRECLAEVDKASHKLMRLISDVFDTSSIDDGSFKLFNSAFSFKSMLRGVLKEMGPLLREKHQTITFDVHSSIPPLLTGDEKRLAQVISNLLTNAVKFTNEKGEIRFEASVGDTEDEAVTLQIEITDNGVGIPKEQQGNLFDIFEQVDGSSSRKHGGIGMGLALSKRIIELMGGDIWVESEPGKGSKFTFTCRMQNG